MTVATGDTIPLVDLREQHRRIAAEVEAAMRGVMERGDYVLGRDVAAFEAEYAAHCESPHAVGLDSGLSALELGLRALGIGAGDEVLTPANSFIASSSAISFTGATPVWVDVDPQTYTIDVEAARSLVTERTRGSAVPGVLRVDQRDQRPSVDQRQRLAPAATAAAFCSGVSARQ